MNFICVFGIPKFRPEVLQKGMQELLVLHEKGHIKPVIGQVFPHEQLNEAHTILENRGSKGKLVDIEFKLLKT